MRVRPGHTRSLRTRTSADAQCHDEHIIVLDARPERASTFWPVAVSLKRGSNVLVGTRGIDNSQHKREGLQTFISHKGKGCDRGRYTPPCRETFFTGPLACGGGSSTPTPVAVPRVLVPTSGA